MNAKARADYHHGALREALIAAADDIIREKGVERFSLREAARRAGVSPGAPSHHFGSATGLLTEVAVLGYRELGRHLADVPESGDPARDVHAFCTGYVVHAMDHPGRFRLMCRKDLVDTAAPAFVEASQSAMIRFAAAAAAYHGDPLDPAAVSPGMLGILASAHGLAHMTIDGKWDFALDAAAPRQDLLDRLLPAMLRAQWPPAG